MVVECAVSTRHTPAHDPQNPSTLSLCINSPHPSQNKGIVSNLFSHTCAHLHPQTLCFDILHKNIRGGVVATLTTVPSRIGPGRGESHKIEVGFIAQTVCNAKAYLNSPACRGQAGNDGSRNTGHK